MHEQSAVVLTTDGAAIGNPGPGGWAALLEAAGGQRLLSGSGPAHTTNNQMELQAVISGLRALKRPCHVRLRADSQYVLNGIQRLLAGEPIGPKWRNQQLWAELAAALAGHTLTLEWVRGHSGDARNERVDVAARQAAQQTRSADPTVQAQQAALAELGSDLQLDGTWRLLIQAPTQTLPARWRLITPDDVLDGTASGVTHPTAMWQALVDGLAAALELLTEPVELHVVTYYDLLVKQGNGDNKVKNANQLPLKQAFDQQRARFTAVRFIYAPAEQVQQLWQASEVDS